MVGLAPVMALLRGLHLAAALSLLGTAAFLVWLLPSVATVPLPLYRDLMRWWRISGLVALVAGVGWFALQAATIADADTLGEAVAALPLVALHTRFGNVLLVRLGFIAAAVVVLAAAVNRGYPPDGVPPHRLGRYLALMLVAAALSLEGLIGHAGATVGAIGDGLVVSEALHLLAAGLWLGTLVPLWFSLRMLPSAPSALVCEQFSPIGLGCVVVLAGTGFAQGLQLIGSVPALLGTRYGQIALLKVTLFLLALLMAVINRFWLSDRLAEGVPGARRQLQCSILIETCAGLAIVTAAAFLASSVPAVHSTPAWPLSWRLSFATINEDPDLRQEVVISMIAIGLATALMIASLLWRRLRLAALVILVLALLLRASSFTLLTAEAYPTSFQMSPTNFSAVSIARGRTLFMQNCAACHGSEGQGNGLTAASLRIKPADLTQPHLWGHSDGELFWWLSHGIDDPEGGLAMPGFAKVLAANDRWALIDYVRAHNIGWAMQRGSVTPVQIPAFAVTCAGLAAATSRDLRGRAVNVVAATIAPYAVPPQNGISTVDLALRDGSTSAPGTCVAAETAAWQAFAVLADVPPDELAGSEFLIDPNGWLRAVHRAGSAGGWNTSNDLIAAIRDICLNPIQPPSGGQHEHHH